MRYILLLLVASLFLGCGRGHSPDSDVISIDESIGYQNLDVGIEGRREWESTKAELHPGYLCVQDSGTLWLYKHPPYTGEGHGDGVAPFTLSGKVMDEHGDPIIGCNIVEQPSNSFGGVDKSTVQARTQIDGTFSLTAQAGAAITMTGEYSGDVYQSGIKEYIIEAKGYKIIEIGVGYGCPELLIYLKSK